MAVGVSSHLLVVKAISQVILYFGRMGENGITHKKILSGKGKAKYTIHKIIKNKYSN